LETFLFNMEDIELLEGEYFKPLKDFEKSYKISNFGRMYSNYSKKLMKYDRKDYYTLSINHYKNKRCHIYDLMLENFDNDIVDYYKKYINKEKIEDLEGELWKDVKGFENIYVVSNYSRIKSLIRKTKTWQIHKEIIVSTNSKARGYVKFPAHKDGKRYNLLFHRIIAEAWIPNPNNFPDVNHINAIRDDNRIENLEWVTHSMNIRHAYKMGNKNQKGEKNNSAKINQNIANNIRIYHEQFPHLSQKEIGKVFGLSREHIKDIVNYKTWNY